MNKVHLAKIIAFGLLLKLLYVGTAFVYESHNEGFKFDHSQEGIISLFKRHDSYWYEKIHNNGYPEVNSKKDLGWHDGPHYYQTSWGFMPGYPLLTKITSSILNTGFDESAFWLAIIFSILTFILFYWLASLWFNEPSNAFYATLLFMACPFQYYFSMMYTEAIFASFLLGSFLAITYKRFLVLAVLTGFMSIIRANGIIMLLPLAVYIIEMNNSSLKELLSTRRIPKQSIIQACSFLIPITCFAIYCWFQFEKTGFYNAYSIAQQGGWYREIMFPLAGLFRRGDFVSQFNSWFATVFMIIAFVSWKKLSLSYNLIVWLNILLPLSAGTSTAMTRYTTILFPLFLIFGFWLKGFKWKYALIPILVLVQLYCFTFWLVSDAFSQ